MHTHTHKHIQPSDSYERVKEAIVRTTIAGWLTTSDNHEYSDIVNPNEVSHLLPLPPFTSVTCKDIGLFLDF